MQDSFPISARSVRVALLLVGTGLWILAGSLPWLSARLSERADHGTTGVPALAWLPALDAPARAFARRELAQDTAGDGTRVVRLLEHSVRARPLHAPSWLLLAEQAWRRGDASRARALADVAVSLWPGRERLQWEAIALATAHGDGAWSLRRLREVFRGRPESVDRVLHVARRLESDPERLLSALVPAAERATPSGEARLVQLLGAAARDGDGALAEVAWSALGPEARRPREVVARYLEALLASRRIRPAVALWRDVLPADTAGLDDPGFEAPFAQHVLGWRVGAPAGARAEHDRMIRKEGRSSLRVSFLGTEDVAFLHVAQAMPVEPERCYRLRGWWRGEHLTTRSGPHLELVAYGPTGQLHVRTPDGLGTWEWARVELPFRVPLDVRLVELRLRRDPLGASEGSPVSGRLWLDELRVEPSGCPS